MGGYSTYRADIDGLRAIAVLSVVIFHAFPGALPGGFVGVDIFFVISGYLICGLISDGLQSGTFTYVDFYARRARRIFPALAVVLAATWAIGWATLLPSDFVTTGAHILGGAAFLANLQNFFEVGYWDVAASNKPLLHLWSLGVEEQFYLVFPTLFVLLFRRRITWQGLTTINVLSFALCVLITNDYQPFAFYSPLARLWEFGAGALLTQLRSASVRPAVAPAGLLLCMIAIVFTPVGGFPGWWTVLPVIGAAMLIAAGPKTFVNLALGSRALVWIGLISYPLYLWHWPLLVLGHAWMRDGYRNEHFKTTSVVAVALAFVLAWVTYEYVEKPIRCRRPTIGIRRIAVGCAASLALVAAIGAFTVMADGFSARYPAVLVQLMAPVPDNKDFPEGVVGRDGPLVLTLGDSHADHLIAGLQELQKERAFRLAHINWYPCAPLIDLAVGLEKRCIEQRAADDARIKALHPDIVLIGVLWLDNPHVDRLRETIEFLRATGARKIIVLGDEPRWRDSAQAEIYDTYRDDPAHRIPLRSGDYAGGFRAADAKAAEIATAAGAYFVSAYDVLCNDADGCLLRLGDRSADIVQYDRTHFSPAGSTYFIRAIAGQIFDLPIASRF
jgi:peptidoglycan/LPS O-acetylase OafA/YrhL